MSALTIPFRYADNLPLIPDPDTFAYIVDVNTGELWDEAGNFDTAINYVQSGDYLAVATQDWLWFDGTVRATQAEVQAAFDRERALYLDCFEVAS